MKTTPRLPVLEKGEKIYAGPPYVLSYKKAIKNRTRKAFLT